MRANKDAFHAHVLRENVTTFDPEPKTTTTLVVERLLPPRSAQAPSSNAKAKKDRQTSLTQTKQTVRIRTAAAFQCKVRIKFMCVQGAN